ncbi:MAG: YqgE/AlgH family protein [Candidatus Cyclobacteriaceae bacterium M3_2C_046]
MNYFHFQEALKPKKGDLLISEPFLPDPNFVRTVVLLCEHNEDGSFGFVLNKPSLLKYNDVMDEVSDFDEILYVGGPVQQDTLHFIHRSGQMEGSIEVGNGIFWGGNFEQLQILIGNHQLNRDNFKFFVGYSGWAGGQLEMELKEKTWIIYENPTAEEVFDYDPNDLWKKVLDNMGGKYKMMSNYPIDPRLN